MSKMEAILIAPCGMNCNICSSYLAFKNEIKSKGIRMPYCAGCRPRQKQCVFLKKRCTLLMNGEVEYCYQCASYPCERLRHIDKRYFLSEFRMSMIENLAYIKKNGMDKFLKKEEEKWRCPECGATICCHNGICYNCGLEKLKNKKKKYRWEDQT